MTAGVYLVHLHGSPLVWVGESANIERRFIDHRDMWVWPNAATYKIVRVMTDASKTQRMRAEEALMRLLRYRGCYMLSLSGREVGSRSIKTINAKKTPQQRLEQARRACKLSQAATSELRSARAKRANAMRRLRNRGRTAFTLASHDQHVAWGHLGAAARWGRRDKKE